MANAATDARTDEIDWDEIGTQWRDREYGALRQAVSHFGWAKVVDGLLIATDSQEAEKARSEFEKAFDDAGPNTDGRLLLALYVYGRCLDAWEHTEDYSGIRRVLEALDKAHGDLPEGAPASGRAQLLANIVSQARLLGTEMSVEEAMNCSCPVAMGRRSQDVVEGLEKLPKQDLAVGKGRLAHLQSVVQSDAETSKRYFDTINKVATTVGRFVQVNAQDRARFDFSPVLKELERAEYLIKGDVFESELRAHRFSLQALSDHARDPHLLIHEAKLVYLYPFALEGISAAKTIDLALGDLVASDPQEPDLPPLSAQPLNVNGLWKPLGDVVTNNQQEPAAPPLRTQPLNLNDLWKPHEEEPPDDGKAIDDAKAHGYSGALIELPPITVTTTARQVHPRSRKHGPLTFTVEVRLSRLGNHHVRVASSLGGDKPASLHKVNQALRRGSHGMGAETLTSKGHAGEAWKKVPDYAKEVIEAIASSLDAGLDAREAEEHKSLEPSQHRDQGGTPKRTRTPVKPVGDATFHVVLAARSIEVEQRDGTRLPATPDSLQEAVGASLLFHPVRHLTTSLEEWIRYPLPTKVTNLLEAQGDASDLSARIDQGYAGDLVVRTDNTTVTYMPASPDWVADEYEEMIEFVASIPPLLTRWENKARDLTRDVDDELERAEDQLAFLTTQGHVLQRVWHVMRDLVHLPSWVVRRFKEQDRPQEKDPLGADPIRRLYEKEVKIRKLESRIREELAFLHSPALCRTRGQRQFLDNLWEAAGLPALERELEQRLSALAERQDRMAVMVSSIDQHVRRKLERPLTIVIGLLAVASLAEVLSWTNQAFGVRPPAWAWVEAAILMIVAVLILFLYWYISYWKRKPSR